MKSSNLLTKLADRLDQLLLVALFAMLCFRLLPQGFPPQHWYGLLLLLSEGVALFFVLTRRPTDKISTNPRDWMIALGGTTAALMVANGETPFLPELGATVILIGFVIHFGAKLSLRRSFGIVPADRGIKSEGLYAYVRHPMYLGYMVSHIGFFLSVPSLWNFAVYAISWALLYARIDIEEKLLSQNSEYRDYAATVRYRIVPGVC